MTFNKYTHLAENVSRGSTEAINYTLKQLPNAQTITEKVTDPSIIPLLFFIMFACVLGFGFLIWIKFRKPSVDV